MKKSAVFVLLLLIANMIHAQTNYFVAQNGADANNGAEATPWLTVQHGINQLSAGDILNIKAGTYFEKLDIDVSGNASAKITIQNYQNDVVNISGAQSTNDVSILWTDNAYLVIKGLHITDSQKNYAQGIALQGTAHHIEIINNKVSKINFSSDPNATVSTNTNSVPVSALGDAATGAGGIPDSVHHISFIGNEIFDNRTGYSENLTVGGNVSNFLMEDNTIYNNTNIGIDATGNYGESPVPAYDHARYGVIRNNHVYNNISPYSASAGIYVDGGENIIVENNLSHHNGYGGEIGCEENGATTNVIFRNNVFHHNTSTGMHFGGYDSGTTGTVLNSQIYNNTFYQNDMDNNYHGELILSQSVDGKIFNNIFFINAQNVLLYAYHAQTNMIFDYNLVYSVNGDATTIETTIDGENNGGVAYEGLAPFYTATGYGTNSIYGDPFFTDAANADFHIPTNSPATNAGDPNHTPDATEVDLDGAARAVNVVDIGVDEFAAPLPVHYLSPFQGLATKNGISLSWITSEEINASHFLIQRLSSNNRWVNIQSIPAGKTNYQILDVSPNDGINIYRLKQIDLDGRYTFSNLVSLLWKERQVIQLFPNPSYGYASFSDHKAHHVSIHNALGEVVLFERDVNEIKLSQNGLYFVTIYDDNQGVIARTTLTIQ